MHRSNFRGARPPRLPDIYRDAENAVEKRVDQTLSEALSLLGHKLAIIEQQFQFLLKQTNELPATTSAMRSKVSAVERLTSEMAKVGMHAQTLSEGVRNLMPMHKNSENGLAMLRGIEQALKDISYRLDQIENDEREKEEPSEELGALISYLKAPKKVNRDNVGNIVGWEIDKSKIN